MEPIDSALATIHKSLAPLNIPWMIIGTTSLYLLGFDVDPKDIDISCSKENAAIVEEVLQPYKFDFINYPDAKFRSRFSKYLINGIMVELMGGLEINLEPGWVQLEDYIQTPITIEHNGGSFLVPGVKDQKQIYAILFNRAKDAGIISMINKTIV